jgi:hypothetical protein
MVVAKIIEITFDEIEEIDPSVHVPSESELWDEIYRASDFERANFNGYAADGEAF